MFIHILYRRYYKRQQQKLLLKSQKEIALKELENNQKLMQLKNEKKRLIDMRTFCPVLKGHMLM